jgi:hypothetical protein
LRAGRGPSRRFRPVIIGNHIGADFRFTKIRQIDDRHGLYLQDLGRFDAAVTSDDRVVIFDEDRVRKPETLNALGDLPDLLLGVGARVSGNEA